MSGYFHWGTRLNRLGRTTKAQMWGETYLLLCSWKDPPSSRRILANSTALRNGTSTSSSRRSSTENLYFFFFIINAIPGAPGPISVIHHASSPLIGVLRSSAIAMPLA
uniref:Uncharacterized protein n=1 Tax=Anopheles atroparvus TaxID=41427 RepID=A0A182J5V9_ANOAO